MLSFIFYILQDYIYKGSVRVVSSWRLVSCVGEYGWDCKYRLALSTRSSHSPSFLPGCSFPHRRRMAPRQPTSHVTRSSEFSLSCADNGHQFALPARHLHKVLLPLEVSQYFLSHQSSWRASCQKLSVIVCLTRSVLAHCTYSYGQEPTSPSPVILPLSQLFLLFILSSLYVRRYHPTLQLST